MADIGAIIDGKYEILREIGHGGMSVVYLAMDTHLNKQWAVKEIKKKGSGRDDEIIIKSLLAEANLMKKLDHPALPRIVDIIDNGMTIFIIMDYIEGESLDKVLEAEGAQSEEDVIQWAKQLCGVLNYLHLQKPPIIYRDMKPANVILKPEGTIKIIDFGIAREYKEEKLGDTTILGTRGYAPPEQYRGRTEPRSDIYALGMTMHHLLTGVNPKNEIYAPVRMWNPDLSEGMESIIDKCVDSIPENRYENCDALLYDLNHPEFITKGYQKTQKRKLNTFIATVTMTLLFAVISFGCKVSATKINNNNYTVLLSQSEATALEKKVESYQQAIQIYPEKIEAYLNIIEAYEYEGRFGKAENDEFLAVYNAHKDSLDKSSLLYAELNYKVGMMYFNYYVNEKGEASFANRVQKAYSFFKENNRNQKNVEGFALQELSDCYYHICSFYRQYILNSVSVEEASRENYEKLLKTMKKAMRTVKTAGAYDQLTLYNSIIMVLYEQRDGLVQKQIAKKEVIDLMENVYAKAKNLSVQKEQSRHLQQEIESHYENYKEAVQRIYFNYEMREEME